MGCDTKKGETRVGGGLYVYAVEKLEGPGGASLGWGRAEGQKEGRKKSFYDTFGLQRLFRL